MFSSAFDAANKTWTETSPEGRTATTAIDTKNRPVRLQTGDLNPMSISYDERGRLETLVHGEDALARTTDLSYYASGPMQDYLETLTDAEGRVTRLEYDAVGRVNKQILPDLREISYDYDANGNLKSLIPPGRPAHLFNYNGVDLEEDYTSPDGTGITNPITHYDYNKDKQLSLVTRPDGKTVSLQYHPTKGQLTTLSIPRGDYGYTYDPTSGKLDGIIAPDGGHLDFAYGGALITDTTWTGEIAGSVTRVYNNDLNIESRSIDGGHTVAFEYDDDLLLNRAGDLALSRSPTDGRVENTYLGTLYTTRH